MKRLWIILTILALLTGSGNPIPAVAGDNVWTQSSQGMWGSNIWALALSPGYASDHTLFAGTYDGGVFKSTDGGDSWSAVNTDLTNLYVQALALSPGYVTDQTLFAGTESGVFKSTDGGASWSLTHLTNWSVFDLVLSPGYATDQTLFAGVWVYEGGWWEGGGVFKSTDGGASWSAMNVGLGNLSILSLAVTPTFPRILFAGTAGSSVWQYTLLPNRVYLPLIVKAYEFDRLTYDPANDFQPALSPDGQTVVFISDQDGQSDVFSVPLMGGQPVNLTQTPSAQEDTPVFSPDGSVIAFASDRSGDWDIYLIDPDGSNVRPALSGQTGTDELHPAFTPPSPPARGGERGGLALVFSSNRANGNWDIYTATISPPLQAGGDGGGWPRLTTHPAADRFPSVSADGETIAFRSERDGNSEIYLMDIDGSNLRRLTDDPAFDGYPSIIPDGSGVVFVSDRSGQRNVYMVNWAGGGLTALEQRPGWQMDTPRLSKNGQLLIYAGGPTGSTLDIYKRKFSSPLMLIAQRGADNVGGHCDWEAGVLAYGWIHAWQATQACPEPCPERSERGERGDDQYRRWAQEWVDACIPIKTDIAHVNDGLLGYAALVAYQTSGQPEYLAFAQQVADYLMNTAPRTTDGTLTHDSGRVWVDTLLGAVPFLMKMAQVTGSDTYVDEAISQVIQHASHLQDPNSGLYHHAWDASGNNPAGQVPWGRGNGWALLADVEVLSAITTTHPLRSTVLGIMQKQAAGLKPLQDASGLWHTVLTRSDSYLETSASALIGYALKRGVQEGWLDKDAYAVPTQAAILGLWRQVLADGTVTSVSAPTWPMLTEEEYDARPHDSFQLYGQGVALLSGCALSLSKGSKGRLSQTAKAAGLSQL